MSALQLAIADCMGNFDKANLLSETNPGTRIRIEI